MFNKPFEPNIKYKRKHCRGRNYGNSYNANTLAFGDFGIKSLSRYYLTSNQIETCRRIITQTFKRNLKLWIRIFPNINYSKKPIEIRLGRGKGEIEGWKFNVKPGRMLFEISDVNYDSLKDLIRIIGSKLPIKIKLVCRNPLYR